MNLKSNSFISLYQWLWSALPHTMCSKFLLNSCYNLYTITHAVNYNKISVKDKIIKIWIYEMNCHMNICQRPSSGTQWSSACRQPDRQESMELWPLLPTFLIFQKETVQSFKYVSASQCSSNKVVAILLQMILYKICQWVIPSRK